MEDQNITGGRAGKVFRVGIYARLSVDGTEKKNESIVNQIEIVRKYVEEQPDMIVAGVYSDLGTTGTNFERPDFQRMLQDIREKRIDCVAVKDFSRFARDYIETGNYLERIFPLMGVRFIAVTDRYDSANPIDSSEKMNIHLKNIVNELYVRDIAQRVKRAKRAKLGNGSYVGGIPAYGYEKHKIQDKYVLSKEKETGAVVQNIYETYDAGKRISEIIRLLYELKVHRPTDYQKTKHVYCQKGEILKQWSEATLSAMLTNPIYIGTLICKGGKAEEPVLIENAHEGIIAKELFERVSASFEKRKSEKKVCCNQEQQKPDIFQDLLYCGECGHKLKRICTSKRETCSQTFRKYAYGCPNAGRIDGEKCKSHFISERAIEEAAAQVLKKEFLLGGTSAKHYIALYCEMAQKKKQRLLRERKKEEGRIERIGLDLSRAYMEYRQGRITKESFLNYKEKMKDIKAALKQSAEEIREKQNETEEDEERMKKRILALALGNGKTLPDENLVHALIKRINVYADARMELQFYFRRSEFLPEEKGERPGGDVENCAVYAGIGGR